MLLYIHLDKGRQKYIFMKKVGYFFLGIVPLGLSFLLQFAASFGVTLLLKLFMHIPSLGPKVYDDTEFIDIFYHETSGGLFGICFALLCALIFGIWYYHFCGGNFLPKVKSTFNFPSVLGTVLMAPGIQLLSSFIMLAITVLLPSQMEEYNRLLEQAGLSNEITIFPLIYAVFLAPISEELIFRGVSLTYFRRAVPFWLANLLQAILFGVFHGNVVQGIYTAVFALLLGFVCKYSGSIYYSILLHFAFNLWGTIVSTFLRDASTAVMLLAEGFMFLSIGLSIFLFFYGQNKLNATAVPSNNL